MITLMSFIISALIVLFPTSKVMAMAASVSRYRIGFGNLFLVRGPYRFTPFFTTGTLSSIEYNTYVLMSDSAGNFAGDLKFISDKSANSQCNIDVYLKANHGIWKTTVSANRDYYHVGKASDKHNGPVISLTEKGSQYCLYAPHK